jgi:hypothetical protein
MTDLETAMIAVKDLVPPSRWMAFQIGFRAGWAACIARKCKCGEPMTFACSRWVNDAAKHQKTHIRNNAKRRRDK